MASTLSAPSPSTSQHMLQELTAVISALIGGARYGVKIRLPHALIMTFLFRKDLSLKRKLHTVMGLVAEHAQNLAAFATIYKLTLAILKSASRSIRSGVGLRDDNENRNSSCRIKMLGRMLISLVVDGPSFSVNKSQDGTSPSATIKAGEPERPYHSLIAGATGGYIIWGRYSSVNHQIVLYLASRILVGLSKRVWESVYQKPGHFGRNDLNQGSILQHPRTYPLVAATVWGIVMLLFEESPHVLHRSLKKSMDEIYRR